MGFAVRVTPTTVYLPFNRDCLRGEFVPAKHGGPPPAQHGHWLLVQEQRLVVVPAGGGVRLPTGELPEGLDGVAKQPLWLGTYAGTPCSVAGLPRDAALPEGLDRKSTRLNSSHLVISYAVFCLKKKKQISSDVMM